MSADGAPPAPAAAVDPGEAAPQFATIEQLNAVADRIGGDFKAGLGRIPHMINEQMKANTPPPSVTPATPAEPAPDAVDPHAEVAALLKSERAELAKEKSAVTRERLRSDIETELVKAGVRPESIKLAADSLMMRNEGKLDIERGNLGESRSIYKDSEFADAQGMPDFVKSFVTGAEGQSILTPVQVPSLHDVPGGRGPVAGEVVMMTRAEASTADPKLLKSGRVQFSD